jgi:hypothetical protein
VQTKTVDEVDEAGSVQSVMNIQSGSRAGIQILRVKLLSGFASSVQMNEDSNAQRESFM